MYRIYTVYKQYLYIICTVYKRTVSIKYMYSICTITEFKKKHFPCL